MEAALRSYLSGEGQIDRLFTAFDRLLDIAEAGEDKEALSAIKILADKLMTAPKDDASRGPEGPQQINVIITEARGGKEPAVQTIDAVEAEYQEVDEP